MIISKTPYRVSLFGGGTDYPAWFKAHGGAVIGFAIDKYCYVSIRELPPFFEHKSRIVYSKVEAVQSVAEIQHPAVRGILEDLDLHEGVEIHHDGDLPAWSGIGSSSSFSVGLINAATRMRGEQFGARRLAEEAIRIEQRVLGEPVGCQDQIWAAYGGMNRIEFFENGGFEISPLGISRARREDLMANLMVFFTGKTRRSSVIAKDIVARLDDHQRDLSAIRAMVDEAEMILTRPEGSLDDLGHLLRANWTLKQGLSPLVSTPEIADMHDRGIEAGALGGKLLGAGGGGFFLFYVPAKARQDVRSALSEFTEVAIDVDEEGSKIVLNTNDV
jgi:D-glycero-alpha-D-manno-heptose-7-phosphate kinase